jgi:hypothetical protein
MAQNPDAQFKARFDRADVVLVIDDRFIAEWHPKYDRISNDEQEYERLVARAAQDMAANGTLSKETFLAIWKWKGAMRVIRLVQMDEYETRYAAAFRRAASEPPKSKLAALLAREIKLPGVDAATGSTIIHFIHQKPNYIGYDPESMPIIDVRTAEGLFKAKLVSTDRRTLAHYDEFRQAIEKIGKRCPSFNLRQIDRALFAYHKLGP